MKNKSIILILLCTILLGLYIGFDIFTHSTIERVIRTDLFFRGYYVKALKTDISERSIPDSQYGTMYICKNPAIGPDSYNIYKKYKYFGRVQYWYINWAGTGGG